MKKISVFDIIGPIMIGPSSSHTAGALRISLIHPSRGNSIFDKEIFRLSFLSNCFILIWLKFIWFIFYNIYTYRYIINIKIYTYK